MKSLSNFIFESSQEYIKSGDIIYLMKRGDKKPISVKVANVSKTANFYLAIELDNNSYGINMIEVKCFDDVNSLDELLQDNTTVLGYKDNKSSNNSEWLWFSTSKEGIKKSLENKYGDQLNSLIKDLNNKQDEINNIKKQIEELQSKMEVDMSESRK